MTDRGTGHSPEERAAEAVVNAWHEAEGESMRDGYRQTMERLIAQALRDSEQSVIRKVLDIVRGQAEAWRAGARRVDEGGVLNLLPGTSAADAAADTLDGQARGAESLAETIAAAFPEPPAKNEDEA